MFKLIYKILIVFTLFTISARSQDFKDILINGNLRISDETILVFSDLPSKNFLDENAINDALKKLYSSGFFKNVINRKTSIDKDITIKGITKVYKEFI